MNEGTLFALLLFVDRRRREYPYSASEVMTKRVAGMEEWVSGGKAKNQLFQLGKT